MPTMKNCHSRWFILAALRVFLVSSYVTRLPCKRNGEFLFSSNKFFDGSHIQTFNNIEKYQCALVCVVTEGCMTVNYKVVGGECKLMKGAGTLTENVGWEFGYTITTDNRGPFCQSTLPCGVDEVCYDTCEIKNFHCVPLVNVAPMGTATQSSQYLTAIAQLAVDGNIRIGSHTDNIHPNNFWKLELDKLYTVSYVRIYGYQIGDLQFYTLKISTDDVNYHVCGKLVYSLVQTVSCDSNQAKFVVIGDPGKAAFLALKEVQIMSA